MILISFHHQFDYFHELVVTQELTRIGARGYGDGSLGGMVRISYLLCNSPS
jgi:hypothetical protein